jgi:hypothetical protein
MRPTLKAPLQISDKLVAIAIRGFNNETDPDLRLSVFAAYDRNKQSSQQQSIILSAD